MDLKNVRLVELCTLNHVCGNPIDGLHCRQCALLRKKLKEVWFTICDEQQNFQDFLNTFESSNDNTNIVNEPQESFVFNQDLGEISSQSPPHIDHQCCYGCGDSLDEPFFNQDLGEISSQSPPHIDHHCCYGCGDSLDEPCHNQNVNEFQQTLPSFHPTCYSGDENSFAYDSTPNFVDDSPNPPPQPSTDSYEFCGNNAHFSHDCPPQESDEFIKSSVENLVPNPSESEDLSNVGRECNVPVSDDFTTFSNLLFDADENFSSSDDKSFSNEDNDDYDTEGDILILEELLSTDSLSPLENESFHFDISSSPRPPAKPLDDDEIEPDSGSLTVKVVGDICEHYVLMPRLFPTQPTLALNEEKSPHLLSHRGFKAFQLSFESPMMIYGGNIPILDVSFLHFYPP
nr:hypothetical protein [Tanacetum cinerariifolium]